MKKVLIILVLLGISFNAFALTSVGDGRKTVAAAGTAEALVSSETLYTQCTVCAEANNTGAISVGASPIADEATREGIKISADDCVTLDLKNKTGDLREVKIDSTVNGDGVTFLYMFERD